MREERLTDPVLAAMIHADQMIGAAKLRARQREQELAHARAAVSLLEPRHRRIQNLNQTHPTGELGNGEQPRRRGQRRVRRADPELHPATPART